ncbi:hypothetical protein BOX15_Mlig022908g2 [Macrostomum lignano]|nr:hypothetical protein BOX15_Mlig022908g2 [Macrostomum lignano]
MEFSGRDLELRSLSRQLCKKSARRGFDFKLMLVGESGIGKTTLIDSLFNVESTRNLGSQYVRGQRDATSTTRLCERFFELEEGGVTVRLTVIDTPGFATELDSNGCVQPVLSYVERQLDDFYRMEQGTDRSKLQDGRVHALLYLINPSSRGLKQLDLMCLKALHSKVNIVPVIGKADTLTTSEKANLKAWILQDLSRHGISVYTLPEFDECFGNQADQHGDDVYLRNQYDSLRSCMPLAVVGANQLVKNANGQWARVREYPWGVVDIDNPEFSDFLKLRELLIMYMEDFKDKTHEVIYEQIRLNRLRQSDWQMSRMTKTLAERERLLREKDEELRRLRDAVEGLQRASTAATATASRRVYQQQRRRQIAITRPVLAPEHLGQTVHRLVWRRVARPPTVVNCAVVLKLGVAITISCHTNLIRNAHVYKLLCSICNSEVQKVRFIHFNVLQI